MITYYIQHQSLGTICIPCALDKNTEVYFEDTKFSVAKIICNIHRENVNSNNFDFVQQYKIITVITYILI